VIACLAWARSANDFTELYYFRFAWAIMNISKLKYTYFHWLIRIGQWRTIFKANGSLADEWLDLKVVLHYLWAGWLINIWEFYWAESQVRILINF